jgi:hypothetical protein
VNRDDAENILLLYRPGTADTNDPQIAEALALAKRDPDLTRWLEEHSSRQDALRAKFRQIAVPAGLREQIISERAALVEKNSQRKRILAVATLAAIVVLLIAVAALNLPRHPVQPEAPTLANYQNQMVGFALGPYGMALATNDVEQIRNFLAHGHAPADYTLPAPLEKVAATGCTVKFWSGTRIAMICFRTGKPLPPGRPGDLWLFVTDSASVKGAPDTTAPQFAQVNQIITATWTQNGKLYLLATEGDEQTIRKYL